MCSRESIHYLSSSDNTSFSTVGVYNYIHSIPYQHLDSMQAHLARKVRHNDFSPSRVTRNIVFGSASAIVPRTAFSCVAMCYKGDITIGFLSGQLWFDIIELQQ